MPFTGPAPISYPNQSHLPRPPSIRTFPDDVRFPSALPYSYTVTAVTPEHCRAFTLYQSTVLSSSQAPTYWLFTTILFSTIIPNLQIKRLSLRDPQITNTASIWQNSDSNLEPSHSKACALNHCITLFLTALSVGSPLLPCLILL